MEHNQDLTVAYVTVKVNGGANVLRNTKLATREKEHADEIINYLKDIEANYPGIMFDEPVLAYTGVEYFDGREFFGVFEFNICGTYSVPDGENLTDSEIRKMIDNVVFEHCEIHLHQTKRLLRG